MSYLQRRDGPYQALTQAQAKISTRVAAVRAVYTSVLCHDSTTSTKRTITLRMKKPAKIQRLGYAVLGLVVQAPMSGYDVRRQFTSTPMGHYSASPGAIYPALSRLERGGYIAGRIEGAKTLRPRKLYRPTPAGKAALAAWVRETPTPREIVDNTSDWLLRLAFATGVLSNAEAAAFLQAMEAACSDYARELQAQADAMPKGAPFPRFALDHGINAYRATAAWAVTCSAQLGKDRRK